MLEMKGVPRVGMMLAFKMKIPARLSALMLKSKYHTQMFHEVYLLM